MKFENFAIRSKGINIIEGYSGNISRGVYQFFGAKDFLLALVGRRKFKGRIGFSQKWNYKAYRRILEQDPLCIVFLNQVADLAESRSPMAILEDYLVFSIVDSDSIRKKFIELREFFLLPIVNSFQNLSCGQKELYQFLIAYVLEPKVIVGIDCFEGLSEKNFNKLRSLLEKEDRLIIFTAGQDRTRGTKIKTLEIESGHLKGSIEDDSFEEVILRPIKARYEVPSNHCSTYSLVQAAHAFILCLLVFLGSFCLHSTREEIKSLKEGISTGTINSSVVQPVILKDSYCLSPVMFFYLDGNKCEIRYDFLIHQGKLIDLNLSKNKAVVSSGLVTLIGSENSAQQWLLDYGLVIEEIIPDSEFYILVNENTFENLAIDHLDSRGNLYKTLSDNHLYLDANGQTIDPSDNAYYLPIGEDLDTTILVKNNLKLGGYYLSEDPFPAILLGKNIQKTFYNLADDPITYRYLATDINLVPSEMTPSGLEKFHSLSTKFNLITILYMFGILLVFISFNFCTLPRSMTSLFAGLKKYRIMRLTFLKSYLAVDQNFFYLNTILMLIPIITVLILNQIVFLAFIIIPISLLIIRSLIFRIKHFNYYH